MQALRGVVRAGSSLRSFARQGGTHQDVEAEVQICPAGVTHLVLPINPPYRERPTTVVIRAKLLQRRDQWISDTQQANTLGQTASTRRGLTLEGIALCQWQTRAAAGGVLIDGRQEMLEEPRQRQQGGAAAVAIGVPDAEGGICGGCARFAFAVPMKLQCFDRQGLEGGAPLHPIAVFVFQGLHAGNFPVGHGIQTVLVIELAHLALDPAVLAA